MVALQAATTTLGTIGPVHSARTSAISHHSTCHIVILQSIMVAESFPSPNAIPPRTSSTGLNIGFVPAAKPVLKPVPEADWIAPSKKLHTTAMPSGPDPPRPIRNGVLPVDGMTWSAEKEKILLGPYDYMVDHPGKDIRKKLIAAFDVWLKVPEESLVIITKVIGMLHTASLL